MGEQLAVRGKLIVLAVVAAGIGAAAAMFTPTLHSTPKARSNAAPVVMRVARPVAQRPARLRHVFRPPAVRLRAV